MPALRNLDRVLVCLVLVGVSALGCQRKAPGPEECARFAEAVVGVHRYITPVMAAQIETQTRECLTRPYDRELLECVLVTRQARRCVAAFHARSASVGSDADQELPQ